MVNQHLALIFSEKRVRQLLVSLLTQSVKKIIYFLNDRILLIFNVLLTLVYTWHACINGNTHVKNKNLLFCALRPLPKCHQSMCVISLLVINFVP